jgi:hypothetical protein
VNFLRPELQTLRLAAAIGSLVVGMLMGMGCRERPPRPSEVFAQAEEHYQRGEYDAALDDYQVFLERHPRSPLTETARMRIRAINREIRAVMDREHVPSPTYVGAEGETHRADRTVGDAGIRHAEDAQP